MRNVNIYLPSCWYRATNNQRCF